MTELLVGTKKGLFVLEGEPGAAFEVTARAFAGEPVEYAMRDPRSEPHPRRRRSARSTGRRSSTPRTRRRVGAGRGLALPEGGDAGARADLGDRARRGRRHAVRRRRPRRAVQDHRRRASWELVRSLWEHPTRPDWTPGGGGLCLHSIAPWPGEPDRLALALSAVGVWLTDDGGETWRHGNRGPRRPLPARGEAGGDARALRPRPPARAEAPRAPVHPVPRRRLPLRRRRRELDRDRRRAAVGLRLPARRRPRRPRQRVRDPAARPTWTASRPRAACASTRRATRGRRGRRAATGLPAEHAYLTVLREAFDRRGEGERARALLRRDVGRRVRLARRRRDLVQAATRLPPVYSVADDRLEVAADLAQELSCR